MKTPVIVRMLAHTFIIIYNYTNIYMYIYVYTGVLLRIIVQRRLELNSDISPGELSVKLNYFIFPKGTTSFSRSSLLQEFRVKVTIRSVAETIMSRLGRFERKRAYGTDSWSID